MNPGSSTGNCPTTEVAEPVNTIFLTLLVTDASTRLLVASIYYLMISSFSLSEGFAMKGAAVWNT
jgi:hypothetical protein